MAEQVLTNAYLSINSVDLSDKVRSIEFSQEIEGQDASRMGTTSRIELPGLIGGSMTVEFNQDYASAKVDATIAPLVSGRTSFAVAWRPVNTTIAATNPEYQVTAFVRRYTPVQGAVGTMDIARVELGFASAVVRDVTP